MGTVGINFGSATSGAGFDVAATVTAIQSISGAIETPWKAQLTKLTAQDTAISTLGTDLATLNTTLQKLTDFAGVTAQKLGSSSNSNIVALTGATSAAVPGSYSVTVSSVEKPWINQTGYVNPTDVLGGYIALTPDAGGPTTTINTGPGETLASFAAKINTANFGVTASVVTDVGGSRLILTGTAPGTLGNFQDSFHLTDTTTGGGAVPTGNGYFGVNAQVNVNGVDYTSYTNTFTTAIPGVTFQVLATSASATNVLITANTQGVASTVNTLVTNYNAVVKDLKTQEGKDSSGNGEPLYGSPVLAQLQSQLSAAVFAGGASGSISSVTQLGITFNNDGTLAVNTDALTTALTNHYSDIVGFLQNAGGFGQSLSTTLNGLGTSSVTGVLYAAQKQNAAQEKALNDNLKNEDALLASQKITLTTELNVANQILQSIPSQLNGLDEIYSAVTGFTASKR